MGFEPFAAARKHEQSRRAHTKPGAFGDVAEKMMQRGTPSASDGAGAHALANSVLNAQEKMIRQKVGADGQVTSF